MDEVKYRVHQEWLKAYSDREMENRKPDNLIVSRRPGNVDFAKNNYLPAAIFPVNAKYDYDLQVDRALDYANYLNKLEEAAKVAYEQIHLVDVLKR